MPMHRAIGVATGTGGTATGTGGMATVTGGGTKPIDRNGGSARSFHRAVTARRFPPPRSVEELKAQHLLSQPSAGVDCEPCISGIAGYVEVILHLPGLTIPNFECP
jgi:hypothetical protein